MTPLIHDIIMLVPELGWATFDKKEAAQRLGLDPAAIHSQKQILQDFHSHITRLFHQTFDPADLNSIPLWESVMEIILCRLEVLMPYKKALARIYQDLQDDPCLIAESFSLDLLETAWITNTLPHAPQGFQGILFDKSLLILYGITLRHWLNNDSQTLDKTMAFLDTAIQGIQKAMALLEGV